MQWEHFKVGGELNIRRPALRNGDAGFHFDNHPSLDSITFTTSSPGCHAVIIALKSPKDAQTLAESLTRDGIEPWQQGARVALSELNHLEQALTSLELPGIAKNHILKARDEWVQASDPLAKSRPAR